MSLLLACTSYQTAALKVYGIRSCVHITRLHGLLISSQTTPSLVYPDDIKPRLLNYIYATLVLSDAEVDCA